LAYALVPVILEGAKLNIDKFMFLLLPLMLTMVIPLFLIKEGEKYGQGRDYLPEARVPLKKSLALTVRNRLFLAWIIPNACAYFGLNMFLTSQNALISGVMNLPAGYAALLNACAFAPVPIMLFIYYQMIKKKGIRFSYRLALGSFAIAILNLLPIPGFDGWTILLNIKPDLLKKDSEWIKGSFFVAMILVFTFFNVLFRIGETVIRAELELLGRFLV
jgi:Na+/melibiose symporter-like transporter